MNANGKVTSGCPPGESSDSTDPEIRLIVEAWNLVSVSDELSATLRRTLEQIERQVTECLVRSPKDVAYAASLTALAMSMIADELED